MMSKKVYPKQQLKGSIDELLVTVVKKVPSQSKIQKEIVGLKVINELDCIEVGLNRDAIFVTLYYVL